jgi:ribosomal RNA-processing protein 7
MLEEDLQSSDEDENAQDDIEMSEEEDGQVTKGRKKQIQKQKAVPKVIPLPTVAMRSLRRTGGIGHIVFTSKKAIDSVLALPKGSLPLVWPKFKASSAAEPSGLVHYISRHKNLRPSLNAIKEHADSSMEVYEYKIAQESKRNSKYKKGEAIVDEDGFTLVTRGGAYGQTLGGGVGVASKKFMEEQKNEIIGGKRNRKKKEQKKEGFYAFQIREKRIQGTYVVTITTGY